jgi:hypothetical protein
MDNLNHYQQEDNISYNSAPPSKKLWNPVFFLVLSALVSFLPAGILYSMNCRRLGEKKKANLSLFFIISGFIVFMLILIYIPMISKFLAQGVNIAVGFFLYKNQSAAYQLHIQNGGSKASNILPIIFSAVFCLFFLVPYLYSMNIPNNSITIYSSDIYYTDNIEIEKAEELGNYLYGIGYISNDTEASFKMDHKLGVYIISIVISKEYREDASLAEDLQILADYLSKDLYNGSEVEVHISDENFKSIKKLHSKKSYIL